MIGGLGDHRRKFPESVKFGTETAISIIAMRKHYCVLLILALPVLTRFSSQAKPGQEARQPHRRTGRIDEPLDTNSFLEDLSEGAIFRFEIAPDLPLFTFKIIPELPENEDGNFPQATVKDIEVFKGDSERPLQHLTDCDFEGMETPLRYGNWFRTDDNNFDGDQDVYLMTHWGATGNQYGCVWLYNRATGRFEYSKEFSELSRYWLDPATKTIRTFDRGGMAGAVHVANQYAVENNRPILIWSETQDWDAAKQRFHCIVQERRNGVMVATRDVWGESDETPCEIPLRWFEPAKEKKE